MKTAHLYIGLFLLLGLSSAAQTRNKTKSSNSKVVQQKQTVASVDTIKYYLNIKNVTSGPFKLSDLQNKAKQGSLLKNTYVWKADLNQWKFAASVAELQGLFTGANNSPKLIPPPPLDTLLADWQQPVDGLLLKKSPGNSQLIAYASVRSDDIMFSKRIWREIDLRDKLNLPFSAPKSNLAALIIEKIQSGKLIAYDETAKKPELNDFDGDAFSTPLNKETALSLISEMEDKFIDSADVKIPNPNYTGIPVLKPNKIVRYQIKEDWIFDKQRSVFEPRIVGIAPMIEVEDSSSSSTNSSNPTQGLPPENIKKTYTRLFWIYFDDLRPFLSQVSVANKSNDAYQLSFDDIFTKRIFSSYIVKESNVGNKDISALGKFGIDALKESERIKKELLDWEHDLWSY